MSDASIAMAQTINRVQLDFGDWGASGRMAVLMAPLVWRDVTVPAGFISDGATVPRWLWWFLPAWGDQATPAAIIHDFLCDALDRGTPTAGATTRAECDRLFREALLDLGLAAWRAWLCWAGVRLFSVVYA